MWPVEAVQAEASTKALQGWLNRGPFRMTHRLDDSTDRYGRPLRTVYRLRPDGSEDRRADFMRPRGWRAGLLERGKRGG
ncbi:MAG: hypothetical protein JKX86_05925 [Verrucomicrobiales bacterium]|nr:hypothetical protein [Verrucomicrobiales bacterium]